MPEGIVEPDDGSGTHGHGLHVIMRSAMHGARGDLALVAMRVDEERLIIQAGLGPIAEDMVGNLMLIRESVAAPVFLDGEPLLVPDYPNHGGAAPAIRSRIGSVIVVPLRARGQVEGALAVGRLTGHRTFTQAELEQLAAFVERTGTARELEGAREERRTALLVEERGRIRDDLHDTVIQELFASGMALQAVADRLSDGELRELVLAQVEALDATTNRIRSLISGLPAMPIDTPDIPLSKRLVAIVDSLTPALHCLPTVVFSGPVEATVGPELSRDLEAVLREALANVARHADATEVQVRVSAQEHRLLLEVIDNGRGVGAPDRSSGLANMRRRAVRQGGELRLAIPEGGGTHLSWDVALRSQRRRTP